LRPVTFVITIKNIQTDDIIMIRNVITDGCQMTSVMLFSAVT